jgi:ankyrin repeat protein
MNRSRRATLLSLAALGLTLLGILGGGLGWWSVRQRLSEELRAALRRDDYPAARTLVRRGADVNTNDDPDYGNAGLTVLELAVSHRDVPFVRELLARGADPKAETVEGITPLLTAGYCGPAGAIPDLLRAGADPNHASYDGSRPLMGAARRGDPEAVRLLLQAGARVELADRAWNTALTYARPNVAPLLRRAASGAPALRQKVRSFRCSR